MSSNTSQKLPRVALVGRPNVGKSSLFNRLLGSREAIVHDRAGVTRDRIQRECLLESRTVLLEDTGGLVPNADEDLLQVVTRQALLAVNEADVAVMLLDGRAGVTSLDENIADLLRAGGVQVIVAVNKIDVPHLEDLCTEAWRLGLEEPVAVSAEHGRGIGALIDRILEILPAAPVEPRAVDPDPAEEFSSGEEEQDPEGFVAEVSEERRKLRFPNFEEEELNIAIVGRPNVGKSSVVNRLLGEERISVSPIPGTTRDAVDVLIRREGRRYRLVDTAGIRKRSRVAEKDESIGIMLSRRRLERCHVAVLVLDATMGPTSQDVGIAGEIVKAGKPFLLALNKWDLVEDPEVATKKVKDTLDRRLQFANFAPRLTMSALTGQRSFKVLDIARTIAQAASKQIRTSELNRFLSRTLTDHIAVGGSAPKMFYMVQTGTLPPAFVLFCRDKGKVSPQMKRFLENRIRRTFGLGPTPVLIHFRSTTRRKRPDEPKK